MPDLDPTLSARDPLSKQPELEARAAAEVIDVGKTPGRHAVAQSTLNELIVHQHGGPTIVNTMSLAIPVRSLDGAEPNDLLAPVVPDLTERLIAAHPGRVYREASRLLERAVLQYVLDVTRGNQLQAAKLLGMNRNTLRKRCRQLALELRRQRASPEARPPALG